MHAYVIPNTIGFSKIRPFKQSLQHFMLCPQLGTMNPAPVHADNVLLYSHRSNAEATLELQENESILFQCAIRLELSLYLSAHHQTSTSGFFPSERIA